MGPVPIRIALCPGNSPCARTEVSAASQPELHCAEDIQRLCEILSLWSQQVVCVASPVDSPSEDAWNDSWSDAIATVHERLAEIQLATDARAQRATEATT